MRTKNKKGDYFAEHYECVKIDPNVDPLLILSQFADTPDSLIMFLKQFSIDKAANIDIISSWQHFGNRKSASQNKLCN